MSVVVLLPIILICSIGTPKADCTKDTSVTHFVGEAANTVQQCFSNASAISAHQAEVIDPEKQYIRVDCIPKEK